VSAVGGSARPVPQAAYARWLDSLGGAGWSPRPSCDGRAGGGDQNEGRDRERVAVGEALGRVTAEPVTAKWPSPRTDCAAMDGIAVREADIAAARSGGGSGLPGTEAQGLAGEAGAVAVDDGAIRLPAGLFEWIDTGDPMPADADTVIVRERLLPQADGSVIITAAADEAGHDQRYQHANHGHADHRHADHGHADHRHADHGHADHGHGSRARNVRAAGEDFGAGQTLVPTGRRLRPGDLAAVAAGGHVTVTVARRPVVAIIPTGDEIRAIGTVPRFGDIIDTNSLMLAARCHQLGVVPAVSAVVPDDPDALAVELRRAAGQADLVLVIAGSSSGRGDHAAAVLAQVGGVAVAGVAVRPGHPALLGHAKRPEAALDQPAGGRTDRGAGIAPVIGLPGYPLATTVIFELFAVPLLGALTGQVVTRERTSARLDRDWSSPADVEDWVPVTLSSMDADDGVRVATPARRGAGSISQLARAAAWWPIPAGQGTFAAGTQIEILPIPDGG
jgi:putative molybdopterin biosynthesis protein